MMCASSTVFLECRVSLFAQEAGGNVAHVCFLHLVIIATVAVDTHILEGLHDGIEIEAHVDEAVDEVLVPALIPNSPRWDHVSTRFSRKDIVKGQQVRKLVRMVPAYFAMSSSFFCVALRCSWSGGGCVRGAPACFTAQSCATQEKNSWSSIIILATSASCGSLGFGASRSMRKDRRAVLMVPTGDQPLPRISRQMAP